ncbi:flagellar biosynthesis protein FlhB [Clostridium sp.]|uniref:flagellar biosynthesis protein FlhB n=1 Tax=Clostridium sp. TaxID=1506 RepID=UPI0026210B61|nr:flagellar biosynthesis protein FlhB [Clostridium sp.]
MSSDKTEQPTAKRKMEARKKGNVPRSREVSNAFTLIGAVICIFMMINGLIKNFKIYIASTLSMDFSNHLTDKMANQIFSDGLFKYMKLFLPMGIIVICLAIIANIIQGGFVISTESMKPKFSKLNPFNGIKNMFSGQAFITTFKNVILLIILTAVGVSFVKKNYYDILKVGNIYFPHLIYVAIDIVKKLFKIAIGIAVAIGALDYAYQLYSHKKGLKMTKQEVKDEYKQSEGDPHVKGQIKQRQREILSQSMIQNTKGATVIINNPTHISIAIRYEREKDSAPVVIAKGADILAMKMREIAKEHDIPMIENVPLARMLYREVDVDQEVPAEMYQSIAEVLVAVYKIKNRYKK